MSRFNFKEFADCQKQGIAVSNNVDIKRIRWRS